MFNCSFDADPTVLYTFWTIMVGLGLNWSGAMCVNQCITQRYLACKSVRDARMYGFAFLIQVFVNSCLLKKPM